MALDMKAPPGEWLQHSLVENLSEIHQIHFSLTCLSVNILCFVLTRRFFFNISVSHSFYIKYLMTLPIELSEKHDQKKPIHQHFSLAFVLKTQNWGRDVPE